jgi:ubiquinone/menaquinone biosynthesis C-methylase UbiE
MDEQMIDTSYEPFSRQPEYIEVNRGFIQSLHLEDFHTVLDLACGTGTLTELVLEVHHRGKIMGLDISHESLVLAQKHFMDQEFAGDVGYKVKNHARVERSPTSKLLFLRGTADCLPFRDQSVHAVVMGNSLHNLPDQDVLLREIRRILKPNCLFAFNTSFFAGTYPPGTENLYHEWLKLALAYIKVKDEERQRQGRSGIPRKRGTSHQAFSKKWPTPEELTHLLMRNSFDVKWFCHRTIMMNQRSLETVGAYAGLARVLLSGYPIKIACEALQVAAGSAFKAIGIKEVRRLWLEVVAVKK